MSKAKRVFATIGLSMLAGAVIGMLYAPDAGAETRRRIRKFRQKFGHGDDDIEKYDRETLEEIRGVLKEQLCKIDKRLDQDAL